MRFLVDENLPPRLAELLNSSGHDAVHIRDLHAEGAPDEAVMVPAVREDRIIVSADTDFGALLASTRATQPSVILVRALVDHRPAELAGIRLANLNTILDHLDAGATVAFTQKASASAPSPCGEPRRTPNHDHPRREQPRPIAIELPERVTEPRPPSHRPPNPPRNHPVTRPR